MGFSRQGWLRLGFLFLLVPTLAHAKEIPHPGTLQEKRFTVPAGQCGLSRFTMETFEYENAGKPSDPGKVRGSMMAAVAETSDPSCLKDYGVVQFIRGCMYNVRYKRSTNQVTEKYFGLIRDQRGKTLPFVFPTWDVDTVDVDPLYQSATTDNPNGRLNLYRYSKKPIALSRDQKSIANDEKVFFDARNYGFLPEAGKNQNRYFVTDLPSFADWNPDGGAGEEEWLNASLEFQTCIYKMKDIPTAGNPLPPGTSADAGGPIACFSWDHKQTFDPIAKTFQSHKGIDTACADIPQKKKLAIE